jgi:hypothetical protein
LGDILAFSHSLEEHWQHLRTLFNQLQQYGILINPAMCVFRASEVTFLGNSYSFQEMASPTFRCFKTSHPTKGKMAEIDISNLSPLHFISNYLLELITLSFWDDAVVS